MADSDVVTKVDLDQYGLNKVASGKVRELFEIDEGTLLFVATDRISAYDVIMENGIPHKGALLTQLSKHWFSLLSKKIPSLQTHILDHNPLPSLTSDSLLARRSMLVRRLPLVPLESIVRGYITGSAWSEYQRSGTVHGQPMPEGLRESQKLERPVWTPSTKAEQGEHDENISPAKAREIVGEDVAKMVEEASLEIYQTAHEYALARGIMIADTKFEFGLDPSTSPPSLVLVDEVLTPDSSRFWPADKYEVGKSQQSYDKQYLRDWLTREGLKGKPGTVMPAEVVEETARKYREAYEGLTGKSWKD